MNWQPTASLQSIKYRARITEKIRAFFHASDCLEVTTPLLSLSTNTDCHIESLSTRDMGYDLYLQTSPEFAMKRLLAAGSASIYQICPAFRAGDLGKKHTPEFTLLEWYRVDFDYHQLMDEMEILITSLTQQKLTFKRSSYRDLFIHYLEFDIDAIDLPELQQKTLSLVAGTDVQKLCFDECLNLLLATCIEPKMRGFEFVYDYPASQASLARLSASNPQYAERFELFYDGMELANGFSELTDAEIQRQRFENDNCQRRANGQVEYPVDKAFLAALESGLPDCAGVALGLDRLLMVLQQSSDIRQVQSFADIPFD